MDRNISIITDLDGKKLVRHAEDNKKYLYDLLAIKKETSSPLESKDCTVRTHFF